MRARAVLLVVLLAASASTAAAELRTLFHTAEERERLERLRRGEPREAAVAPPRAAARPSSVTGFVKRSDGKGTVWIDGKPHALGDRPTPGISPSPRRDPGASTSIEIKPGH